jgi:hypothetical protein
MARSTLFYTHESSRRDAAWFLEQDDDGSLHAKYEDELLATQEDWRMPINDFLSKGGMASHRALLVLLLDRLFEDRNAQRS